MAPKATVIHMLSKFEMEFEVHADHRAHDIEKILRRYCHDLGDEKRARLGLVGLLMERLKTGETCIDVENLDILFKKAGLEPNRMRQLASLNETLASFISKETNRFRYRPEPDIRERPQWPPDKAVLLISGDSGVGKTWQLSKIAQELAESRHAVVWVNPAREAEETLSRAMQVVWQEGLGGTNEKTPFALTAHYRELAPQAAMPWLTILVDDVQDIDTARELVQHPWERWGMRLAVSLPSTVALALEQDANETIHIHSVGQFSDDEVNALFVKRGRNWIDLPYDLQKLLRAPILAGLYLDLPYKSFRTAPNSEYEIFEAYWKRKRRYTQGNSDDGVLLHIAARVLDDRSYPIERAKWFKTGLEEVVLDRLQASGWLQCETGGHVAFAHDRLLNWAAAEKIADDLGKGNRTPNDVGKLMLRCSVSHTRQFTRPLGYVPMDLFWLVSINPESVDMIANIIAQLEESGQYGSYGIDLYVHHLPTQGARAIPLLMTRLDNITYSGKGDYRVTLIARGLVAIATQETVDLTEKVADFLDSHSPDKQAVGIKLATAVPDSQFLDRIWELHLKRCEFIDNPDSQWCHSDYDASASALRAGIKTDPDWLRRRILTADPNRERVSEPAYQLNSLEHPRAEILWHELKDSLLQKLPADRRRSLLYCIGRFFDRSMVDLLIGCLGQEEDFAGAAAFASLVKLDPDKALERLSEIPEMERAFWREWWLPPLLNAMPEQTRQKLFEMAEGEPEGRRFIELLFTDRANELNHAMLRFHLKSLENDLEHHVEAACQNAPNWLTASLELLKNITHPDLLELLSREAGGKLEAMITKLACARIPHLSRHYDHTLEKARHFLIHVGGDGITTLINQELSASHYLGRHRGLRWAFLRPDPRTIQLLTQIARRPISKDSSGKQDSGELQEQALAIKTLASIGTDEELVDIILQLGWHPKVTPLRNLRNSNNPMDRTLTDRASKILSNPTVDDNSTLRALLIAWLSSDSNFIPSLHTILSQSAPESDVAGVACLALAALGDRSTIFAEMLLPQLKTTNNRERAKCALMAMGEKGLPHLRSHLNDTPFGNYIKIMPPEGCLFLFHGGLKATVARFFDTRYDLAIHRAGRYDVEMTGHLPISEIQKLTDNHAFSLTAKDILPKEKVVIPCDLGICETSYADVTLRISLLGEKIWSSIDYKAELKGKEDQIGYIRIELRRFSKKGPVNVFVTTQI